MSKGSTWEYLVQNLPDEHKETMLGTSLSKRFTKLPLWLSHPSNIGGFYGILVSIALILPYAYGQEDNSGWLADWIFHSSLLISACFFLGFSSNVLIFFSKRPPVAPPRKLLYPMPFLGLALLIIDRVDFMTISPIICWMLILLPGPMYVHLSWAPRWRLLCMIEDGKNPFENFELKDETDSDKKIHIDDEVMKSVIDKMDSEE